jgi:hypothetical protein
MAVSNGHNTLSGVAIYQEIIVDCVNGGVDNVSNMQLMLVRRASDLSLFASMAPTDRR